MSVSTSFSTLVSTNETLETNVEAMSEAGKVVGYDQYDTSLTLDADSSPPATKCAFAPVAMTAGAATIDLAALTGANGATVNLTGLKVQVAKFKAKADNAGAVTLSEGASNGYELGGNTWKFALLPGMEITIYGNDATPDVGSGAKNMDMAGTLTDAVEVSIIAG